MLEIREAIQRIVKDSEEIYSVVATVTAVDEAARTIDVQPIDGSAELFDVKLQANIDGTTGLTLIPELESYVIVTFLSKDTAFMALATSVDKVILDTPEIIINKGDLGTVPVAEEVLTKLNNIENWINSFLPVWAAHVHTDPLTGFTGTTPAAAPTAPIVTTLQDINNPIFKH